MKAVRFPLKLTARMKPMNWRVRDATLNLSVAGNLMLWQVKAPTVYTRERAQLGEAQGREKRE